MDWKRIAPWNWFKEEESSAPVTRGPSGGEVSPDPWLSLRSEMDRWFEEAVQRLDPALASEPGRARRVTAPLRPSVDISEGKKAYTVRAEIPGVEREDVSIEVESGTLVIRAEKRFESQEEDEGYHCVERSYGSFQRVLSLPDDADEAGIEARFKNGVLKLRIPKHAARASRGRGIEIQQG